METTESDLVINITDPIKNDQGMVGSYISYKVNTETTLEVFDDKQFSVIRRYSDFSWLRIALVHALPGIIVPPLPEKAVMNRFSAEFIEARRRSLERFMARCAEHPTIREDATFRMFLAADDDKLNRAKAELKKVQGETKGSGSFFSSITGAPTPASEKIKSPEDAQMEEIAAYVANLEAQMQNVAKHTAALMKRGKELSQGLFDFGLAFTILGQHETPALTGALSSMGHTADQLSLITASQVEKEQKWFEEPITDYLSLLGAVREAVDKRQAVRKAYFACLGDLEAKKAAVAKLKASTLTPQQLELKVPPAEQAVDAAADAEAAAKALLAEVTARVLWEVGRFKRAKADDMRKVVLDYVQLQIEYNKEMEQQWATLVPEIEAIQVDPNANAPIFGGSPAAPLPPAPAGPSPAAPANPFSAAAAAAAEPTPPPVPTTEVVDVAVEEEEDVGDEAAI